MWYSGLNVLACLLSAYLRGALTVGVYMCRALIFYDYSAMADATSRSSDYPTLRQGYSLLLLSKRFQGTVAYCLLAIGGQVLKEDRI